MHRFLKDLNHLCLQIAFRVMILTIPVLFPYHTFPQIPDLRV